MPPVAGAITLALVETGIGFAASIAIGNAVASVLGALVISGLGAALRPKPQKPELGSGISFAARDRVITVREPVRPRTYGYGEVRLGGTYVLIETTSSNARLQLALEIAGRRVAAIGEIQVADEAVSLDGAGNPTAGRYQGVLDLRKHLGFLDQPADAALVSKVPAWTASHRARGRAYLAAELTWNRDKYPNGVPNLTALTRLALVYDPRIAGVAIASSAIGSPGVVTTAAPHGLVAGDVVFIRDHAGAVPALDGHYQVASVPSATSFTVLGHYRDGPGKYGEPIGLTAGGSGGTVTRCRWHHNPALALADFLMDADVGFGVPWARTVEAELIAAANVCDEEVAVKQTGRDGTSLADAFTGDPATDTLTRATTRSLWNTGDRVSLSTGGTLPAPLSAAAPYYLIVDGLTAFRLAATYDDAIDGVAIDITDAGTGVHSATRTHEPRYAANGTFSGEDPREEVVKGLLGAMAGHLVAEGGTFRIYAGAYRSPTAAIDEGIAAGPIAVNWRVSRRERFNAVKGVHASRYTGWQPADFPLVTSAAYEAEDGARIVKDIELPWTISAGMAQRIARIDLERARREVTTRWPLMMKGYGIVTPDVIAVTRDRYGWSAKEFEVTASRLSLVPDRGGNPAFRCDLECRETDANVFAWTTADETPLAKAPASLLPSPFDPPVPPNLQLESGNAALDVAGDGTVVSRIKVSWDPIQDAFVTSGGRIEVELRKATESAWQPGPVADGAATVAFIAGVKDGVSYDVRARTVNVAGIASAWETVSGHVVVGKSDPPGAPDTFTVARLADGTRRFTWTHASPDPDVRAGGGYRIRYSADTGAAWPGMTPLHTGLLAASPWETNELAAGTYKLGIVAVDSSGNESLAPVFIIATLGDPRLRNALYQALEHDRGWPGTRTSCFVSYSGRLVAVASQAWSDLPASWSALAGRWQDIVASVSPLSYETLVIDLGADVSVSPLVSVEGEGTPTIEMRTGTEADGGVVGAYGALAPVLARYLQVRVQMGGASPRLDAMTVVLDGERAIEAFEDVDTATETAAWFERIAAGHFKVATKGGLAVISQAQIVALQSVGGAWTWELVSKSALVGTSIAAELKVRDGAGALADAVIDVELRGPKAA